jgi:hypothetical protein
MISKILLGFFILSASPSWSASSLYQQTIPGGTKAADGTYSQLARWTFRTTDPRSENALVTITQNVSMFSIGASTAGPKWTSYKLKASLRGVITGAPGTGRLYDQEEKEVNLAVTQGANQSSNIVTIILGGNDLLPGEYEVILENWAPNSTQISPVRFGTTRAKIFVSSKF